eukprot:6455307-Amphidinium_carterae.1
MAFAQYKPQLTSTSALQHPCASRDARQTCTTMPIASQAAPTIALPTFLPTSHTNPLTLEQQHSQVKQIDLFWQQGQSSHSNTFSQDHY